MSTTLVRDDEQVPMPVLPWGITKTLTSNPGYAVKTGTRVSLGCKLVTLFCPAVVTGPSVVRFAVGAQDEVEATDDDPDPVMVDTVVDVPIPHSLVVDDDTGAGVSIFCDDADVLVYVIERA